MRKPIIYFAAIAFLLVGANLFIPTTLSQMPQTALTMGQVLRALASIGDARGARKRVLSDRILADIRRRKVDFPLTRENESLLRGEGASDEFIETVRLNARRIPPPTPGRTPANSTTASGYFDIAYNCFNDKRDYDCAILNYTRAIELKPDYLEAYNNRGIAYKSKGEYDRAIRDYNKAIELKPDYATAFNNRGNAYYAKENYDLAIRDYDRAIELETDYATAYYNRGSAYDEKGDYDQAIIDYDKAIELKPDYVEAFINRGITYKNKRDYDQAIRDYNKVLELTPNDAVAYNNRASAYDAKGNYDQAISDYRRALQLNPNYRLAQENLNRTLAKKNN